jgi:CMP-2-keto-3-deoxyoctulosonic acid synthetase
MQIIEVEFKEKIDILVMVQGDEPLIKPETIRKNNL